MILYEDKKRLSDSLIVNGIRDSYISGGLKSWTACNTPSYLTNSPLFVNYCLLALKSFLYDNKETLSHQEPIYIFDLGAGTGRFAYRFLKSLSSLASCESISEFKIVYIISDIAEENIESCRRHAYLQDYIKRGILDFAYFDGNKPEGKITLLEGGTILGDNDAFNPVFAIAGYFFDSLNHDYFKVEDGELYEGLFEVKAEKRSGDHIEWSVFFEKTSLPYYDCQYANKVLDFYLKEYDELTFTLPLGAFFVADRLLDISGGRLIVITGDHGAATSHCVLNGLADFSLSRHGTCSIPVNMHAFGEYVRLSKGLFFVEDLASKEFAITASVWGCKSERLNAIFSDMCSLYNPLDYWRVFNLLENCKEAISLKDILILLKMGGWDPADFDAMYNVIFDRWHEDPLNLKKAMKRVWDNFYPVEGEENALQSQFVRLYAAMGDMLSVRTVLENKGEVSVSI